SPILWFSDTHLSDLPRVGGKNASLGEMINSLSDKGIAIPDGFCVTAECYREYLTYNGLDSAMEAVLNELSTGTVSLSDAGQQIRDMILGGEIPAVVADSIVDAYSHLGAGEIVPVAVRSSATAEDLPQASFAGQQESFLNVRGVNELLQCCKRCFASLYTNRAIAYREENGFAHQQVALSIGVQCMVRADKGCAGVAFTLDTETGFPRVVLITGSWGLGESVVQGRVIPDKYMVFKPLLEPTESGVDRVPIIEKTLGTKEVEYVYSGAPGGGVDMVPVSEARQSVYTLSDKEVIQLSRWCCAIERHYGRPMDIEWAKDGEDGLLYILQARPETIESQKPRGRIGGYRLYDDGTEAEREREVLVEGCSVGGAIATGEVCIINDVKDSYRFKDGAILVTERTDPDWVPLMRRAAGIITDSGGTTSHAAIVSRELQVPAIVGTVTGTSALTDGQTVTLSCAEGVAGKVYKGALSYESWQADLSSVPETKTRIMLNMAMPDSALMWWQLPVKGIGLTRIEFIISAFIKVHPMALVHFEKVTDHAVRQEIETLTAAYPHKPEFFVEKLARGMAKIAASQYPEPVIVRMSDFKSNEYRSLLGGEVFEMEEANPMLGFRGASRYHRDQYKDGFKLECQALKRAREDMGLSNIIVMIPFCRTCTEAQQVLDVMAECGLVRGENGLQVYVMCEIPSNVILADQFSSLFDGFSIGSNDLTQLVLGVDRDSEMLSDIFDARDEAVKRSISDVIRVAHHYGRKVGICGQAPSDHPEFAAFLVEQGIDSISLNPDSVIGATDTVARAEAALQDKMEAIQGVHPHHLSDMERERKAEKEREREREGESASVKAVPHSVAEAAAGVGRKTQESI
ncbi:phosphoenolpyruvate synthase, partial [Kipferlia bialata]